MTRKQHSELPLVERARIVAEKITRGDYKFTFFDLLTIQAVMMDFIVAYEISNQKDKPNG